MVAAGQRKELGRETLAIKEKERERENTLEKQEVIFRYLRSARLALITVIV